MEGGVHSIGEATMRAEGLEWNIWNFYIHIRFFSWGQLKTMNVLIERRDNKVDILWLGN